MAERTEHIFKIDRRRLLAITAAASTATVMPPPGEAAAGAQPALLTAKVFAQVLSSANVRRLLEIVERNNLRQEFGLPPLSVAKELRRMKSVEATADYARFCDKLRGRVRQKTLARIRRKQNDPNWKPADRWAGIAFETEVRERLSRLFARIG